MRSLSHLKPQPLWDYFEDISQVPRPSKKEDKIIQFLLDFAKKNKLLAKRDEIGNVLISKPATKGREGLPVVVLQSHMDMVCEKNSDKEHDFDNDPIEIHIDNDWVKANGTTLGADCGIGMAASMAVLTSTEIKHGPVECLFTVDEETGLSGAFALKPDFISGKILLNLDSEDEGELFMGCAGGVDTLAELTYNRTSVPKGYEAVRLTVKGLLGGHSGDDIHKNRGNAIKILTRFLKHSLHKYDGKLALFDGGNLRNAIAREAFAVVDVSLLHKELLQKEWESFVKKLSSEYKYSEPNLTFEIESVNNPEFVIDKDTQERLINALTACPHGVIEMSTRMEGMVETSTNLASVKFSIDHSIIITTSQRSEIKSRKDMIASVVHSVFELAGASVKHTDGYPGWTPNPDSPILKIAVQSYAKLFGNEPVVKSIHAGLECGLFLEKYPELDMVSFGPTIKGAHSPDERIDIHSTEKFWRFLVDLIERL